MSEMGVWKKTLVYLGLVEQDDFEDEIEALEEEAPQSPPTIRKISREEMSSVHQLPTAQPLGQVAIVAPTSYDDAQEIGDKLRASVPVIMNLQGAEEDLFKRLTAFAAGLAYGLNGEVQRLGPRMYLVTPANVEVSAEDRQRLKRGLFNEF